MGTPKPLSLVSGVLSSHAADQSGRILMWQMGCPILAYRWAGHIFNDSPCEKFPEYFTWTHQKRTRVGPRIKSTLGKGRLWYFPSTLHIVKLCGLCKTAKPSSITGYTRLLRLFQQCLFQQRLRTSHLPWLLFCPCFPWLYLLNSSSLFPLHLFFKNQLHP